MLNNIEAWLFWAAANLIVSWWLALVIDLIPVVFLTLISIGWGHISEGVKGSVELFNGIKNTIKPIFYAASMWVSWVIIFESIYKLYNDGNPGASEAAYTPRVRNMPFSFRTDNPERFHLTSSVSVITFHTAVSSHSVPVLPGRCRQRSKDDLPGYRTNVSQDRVQGTVGRRRRIPACHRNSSGLQTRKVTPQEALSHPYPPFLFQGTFQTGIPADLPAHLPSHGLKGRWSYGR